MTALVDANLLIAAGRVGAIPALVGAAAQRPWRLTREVLDELIEVPGRGALTLLVRASPQLGTPEANLIQRIVGGGGWGKLGVGEASCIAAAVADPELSFVTWDKGAAWRALHELRGRTVVGHTWLQELVDVGAIEAPLARRVADADRNRHPPSWW